MPILKIIWLYVNDHKKLGMICSNRHIIPKNNYIFN